MLAKALHRWRAYRHDRRGAAIVEFALFFPVFLIIVLGLIETALFLATRHELMFGLNNAARTAFISGGMTSAQIKTEIGTHLTVADLSNVTITTTEQTALGNQFIRIDLSYPYSFQVPIINNLASVTVTLDKRVPL